ncbi:hypothetical protein CDD82_4662 [Ophiocordyceps australis]|uniref:DUF1772 domain-containing protein n=1 Tax=Ophiocordyceps australis TaxID=1399860 RepID=A0A2C5ZV29_9HYPO|nr:hypothetical protein CDD82_4662 [Ophiocordyceps australis]
MQLSGPSLIAVATGIVGSAWSAGAIMSLSVIAAPAANAVPQTTARVWSELYERGATIMPKVGAAVALSYAYAAGDIYGRGPADASLWQGLAAAAACVLAIVPFTLTAMKATNGQLHVAVTQSTGGKDKHVEKLMETWGKLNFVRGLFPLMGTMLGIKVLVDGTQ